MERLVSTWSENVQSLPQNYIFPPETRPGSLHAPLCATVPVIDLTKSQEDRNILVQEILKASQEFGFFQVINHGVSEELMNRTMSVFKEFFALPPEDKASLFTDEPKQYYTKNCSLYTSGPNYATDDVHFWRDSLRHLCHPLEKFIQHWPQKPIGYREVVGTYSVEARKLSLRVLELIGEGLGLESGYFGEELTNNVLLSVNHYPKCPEPSLALGLPKHCDPDLITVLLQDDVFGLQVLKDGEWVGVEPIPNAFVVNIGYQLQIISNGKVRSAHHRVVTNSSVARTSCSMFINPSSESFIEPAKALISPQNPQLYRAFQCKDFLMNFAEHNANDELVLAPFKLQT